MKMVVTPTHRVLYRNMQIPERVSGRNENLSPYRRQDFDKVYFESQQVTSPIHHFNPQFEPRLSVSGFLTLKLNGAVAIAAETR